MATITENTTNNTSNNKYQPIFDWLRKELDSLDNLKRDLIKDAADRLLAEGMRCELICSAICTELEGRVSDRYVQMCLPKVFKQQQYVAQAPMKQDQEETKEETRNISPFTAKDNSGYEWISDQDEEEEEQEAEFDQEQEEQEQQAAAVAGQWLMFDCSRFVSTIWHNRDKQLWIKHDGIRVLDVWPTRR